MNYVYSSAVFQHFFPDVVADTAEYFSSIKSDHLQFRNTFNSKMHVKYKKLWYIHIQ